MDIVHIVVLVVVCTFSRDLSAPILTLETFLRRIIRFASNNIRIVGDSQYSVRAFKNQSNLFIDAQGHTDSCQREPFAFPLDFFSIVGNEHLSDLRNQTTARVDGLEAEHLIENNIVGTVRLAHKVVNLVRGHEAIFEFYPVVSFAGCHQQTSLERQVICIVDD